MKTKFLHLLLFLVLGSWLPVPVSFAKPERFEIKKAEHRSKERAAKSQIKNIDLRSIEDPEARRAIREILNYLNLPSQK